MRTLSYSPDHIISITHGDLHYIDTLENFQQSCKQAGLPPLSEKPADISGYVVDEAGISYVTKNNNTQVPFSETGLRIKDLYLYIDQVSAFIRKEEALPEQ